MPAEVLSAGAPYACRVRAVTPPLAIEPELALVAGVLTARETEAGCRDILPALLDRRCCGRKRDRTVRRVEACTNIRRQHLRPAARGGRRAV